MIRRASKLEAARARNAELESDLGWVERPPETEWEKYRREGEEARAQYRARERKQESDEARKFICGFIYIIGAVVWPSVTFGNVPPLWHRHPWMLWVTGAWDLPAAIALAIGSITFIGWLVTGRNLLGRWL